MNNQEFLDELNVLLRELGIKTMEDRIKENQRDIMDFAETEGHLPSKTSPDARERRLAEAMEGYITDRELTLEDHKIIQSRLNNLGFDLIEIKMDPLDDGEGEIWAPDNISYKFKAKNGYIGISACHAHTIKLIESIFGIENITRFYLESYYDEFFFLKKPEGASLKECKKAIHSNIPGIQVDFHTDFYISSTIDFDFLRYHLPQIPLSDTPEFDLDRWKEEYKRFQVRLDEWKL